MARIDNERGAMAETHSICLDCLYGSQPYGYFPIVCVHGKRIVEMWHEKFRCRYFKPCPEPEPPPRQELWRVILTK